MGSVFSVQAHQASEFPPRTSSLRWSSNSPSSGSLKSSLESSTSEPTPCLSLSAGQSGAQDVRSLDHKDVSTDPPPYDYSWFDDDPFGPDGARYGDVPPPRYQAGRAPPSYSSVWEVPEERHQDGFLDTLLSDVERGAVWFERFLSGEEELFCY